MISKRRVHKEIWWGQCTWSLHQLFIWLPKVELTLWPPITTWLYNYADRLDLRLLRVWLEVQPVLNNSSEETRVNKTLNSRQQMWKSYHNLSPNPRDENFSCVKELNFLACSMLNRISLHLLGIQILTHFLGCDCRSFVHPPLSPNQNTKKHYTGILQTV